MLTVLITLAIHGLQCRWTMRSQQWGQFAKYMAYQVSYLAALMLISVAVVGVWRALSPRLPAAARGARWILVWLGLIGLGAGTLAPDLENLSIRLGGDHAGVMHWALIAGVAGLPPLAFFVASKLIPRHRGWSYLIGIGACGMLTVNEFILEQAYGSGHLFLFITGFYLLYLALPGPSLALGRAAPILWGLVGLVAAYGFWSPPDNRTRLSIAMMDSASLAHFVLPLQRGMGRGAAKTAGKPASGDTPEKRARLRPEWFTPPPVPPPAASPFAEDGIVILITIDALRGDLFHRAQRAKDVREYNSIARQGTYFRNVFSPSTATRFSIGAMMTGFDVTRLSWRRDSFSQAALTEKDPPLLTEYLQADGVRTIIAVPNPYMYLKNSGFVRGIDELQRFPPGKERYARAKPVITWMLDRLSRIKKGERAFIYTHLMDPHAPYDTVTKKGKPFPRYLAEVRAVGREMTRLWSGIREQGLQDRVALIISADHGESFGRHGQFQHNNLPYEGVTKVPLIIVAPGVKQQTMLETVSLIDITPTVLELFGISPPEGLIGRSLNPTLFLGEPVAPRPLISANYKAGAVLFPDRHKVIVQYKLDTTELYDVKNDFREARNLCLDQAELCELYRAAADRVRGGPWPGRRR